MPAATLVIPTILDTEQKFRDAVIAVRGAIAAVGGLVRTGNTGQIDPTTVLFPARGAMAGYDVFRFDDALQATTPVFIRIGYQRGMTFTSSDHLMCEFRVSRGTDGGIGASVEDTITEPTMLANYYPGVVSSEWLVSSGPGRLCFCPFWSETDQTKKALFTIERTRDAAGVVTSEGTCIYMDFTPTTVGGGVFDLISSNHNPKNVLINRGIGVAGGMGGSATGVKGSDTYVLPIYPDPRIAPGRLTNLLACYAQDFQHGTQHVIDGINYRALTSAGDINLTRINTGSATRYALNDNIRRLVRFD